MTTSGKILLIILLLMSGIYISAAPHLDQKEEPQYVTGFRSPKIDGFILTDDTSNLGEWEDALQKQVDLPSSSGTPVKTVLLEKIVENTMYVGMSLTDILQDNIGFITLQLDRDMSGDVSKGDVRVYVSYVTTLGDNPNNVKPMPSQIIQTITSEVYDGFDWVIPNGLQTPLAYNWADFAITQQTYQQSTILQVEIGIDLNKIEKELPDFPSKFQFYPNGNSNQPAVLNYGISIDLNDGRYLGFPQVPEPSKDLRPSTVTAVDVVSYEAVPILPQRDVGIGKIIFMQSTQTENNDYRVIRGKESLVRVMIDNNAGTIQHVRVILKVYHYHFIALTLVDTQEQEIYAIVNPRLASEASTANFYLSANVTDSASLALEVEVQVVGEVQDPDPSNNKDYFLQIMTETEPINIYYSKMNVLDQFIADSTADFRMTIARMMYPQKDVNFIEVNWRDMGGRLSENNPDLYDNTMNRWRNIWLAQIRASIRNGWPVPAFPDQVHGFTPMGSGRADASWAWGGGTNRVSWSGGNGNPTTLAHEINHNLDGGWGKHATGHGYGCGAPDGTFAYDWEWNGLYGDNYIHDLGWNSIDGIITGGQGELMTYCFPSDLPSAQSFPVRWIGGYRWEKWIDRFAQFPSQRDAGASIHPNLGLDATTAHTVRTIDIVGSGSTVTVQPSFEFQGDFNSLTDYHAVSNPQLRLELVYKNLTSVLYDFNISRIAVENYSGQPESLTDFSISQLVPDDGQLIEYYLYNMTSNKLLTSHSEINHSFTTYTQYDTQIFRGKDTTVYFGAANNISKIYFQLMFSPDGYGWYPIGDVTTNDHQVVQINDLPGGSNSKFIVLASDGLKTVASEGSPVNIPHKAPILSWRDNAHIVRAPTAKDNYTVDEVPYNTTVGSPISLSVTVQNEWGHLINNPVAEWSVKDSKGVVVKTMKDQVDYMSFKLGQAGDYVVTVTMTDPITGVSSSLSQSIRVAPVLIAAKDGEYQTFMTAINKIRANYGVTSSTTSSSSSDLPQVTESNNGNPLALPVDKFSIILGIGFAVMVIQQKRWKTTKD